MGGHWESVTNLLCVRLDAIGDLLMTTPALRALKEGRPGRSITLLTSEEGAGVARYIPEVDDVIVYRAPWVKPAREHAGGEPDRILLEHLTSRRFDGAVIFTVHSQSPLPAALLCYLAGIPRIAAHCRENPYHLVTDWIRESEPARHVRHEVRRQLDLATALGGRTHETRLSLRLDEAALRAVRVRLAGWGIPGGRPWAIIHPGATAPSRRYRPDGFARAADMLVQQHGWRVVFTGGEEEVELVESIRRLMDSPSRSLAGELSLGELIALIALAPLIIVNNTGPAHIAAAVGTPVVNLYALTNLQHTPWRVMSRILFHDVPCRGCMRSVCPELHHNCLAQVSPDEVKEAALDLYRARLEGRTATGPEPFAGQVEGYELYPGAS